jgi:four helix bundle protein
VIGSIEETDQVWFMRNFRELRVWNDSLDFAAQVYEVTLSFPKEEAFGISRQLRRSAVSIASNIAEGCSRSSDREFCHYLEIGLGSAFEAETQIILTCRVGMLAGQLEDQLLSSLHRLQKAIANLIKTTRAKTSSPPTPQ